mgnify:CR=1 FL=1
MSTFRDVAASATNCSNIRSITTEESYSTITASAVIECDTTTLSLGDAITVGLGYDTATTIFSGYCKKIERSRPDNVIRITAFDNLIRAVDFFIAADDPEAPFQRNNITSLNLVTDLLALCGITSVTTTEPVPTFVWGTNEDGARFNLQSVADGIQFVANITGNTIYWDSSATRVEFKGRKPYVDAGDVSTHTFSTALGNLTEITYHRGTDKTRNVIKVYGRTPIVATASASNPYLVVDQAVVLAHEMIDTQAMADGAASVNLTMLNRLDEKYEITIEGDNTVKARDIGTVTESFVGASARDVFIYRCSNIFNESGWFTSMTCIP